MEATHLRDGSPLEDFARRTANMPNVWEVIMSNMSATDVARCLKVCHALRFAIAQCLNSNTSLRRQMDIAASVSAISRSNLQSTTQCQFRHKYNTKQKEDLIESYGDIYALDQTWYHQCRYTGTISIIRRSNEGTKTVTSFRRRQLHENLRYSRRSSFHVQPTMNPDKVFIKQEGEETALVDLALEKEESMPVKFDPALCWELELSTPACIRYRLVLDNINQRKAQHPVVMVLAGDDGRLSKRVTLYRYQKNIHFPPDVKHQASQEQVSNHRSMQNVSNQ